MKWVRDKERMTRMIWDLWDDAGEELYGWYEDYGRAVSYANEMRYRATAAFGQMEWFHTEEEARNHVLSEAVKERLG